MYDQKKNNGTSDDNVLKTKQKISNNLNYIHTKCNVEKPRKNESKKK